MMIVGIVYMSLVVHVHVYIYDRDNVKLKIFKDLCKRYHGS